MEVNSHQFRLFVRADKTVSLSFSLAFLLRCYFLMSKMLQVSSNKFSIPIGEPLKAASFSYLYLYLSCLDQLRVSLCL